MGMQMTSSGSRSWLGAKVDHETFDHIEKLATSVDMTRSQVVRLTLRHTTIERLLEALRRQALAGETDDAS